MRGGDIMKSNPFHRVHKVGTSEQNTDKGITAPVCVETNCQISLPPSSEVSP
jgi:hypothetical protein